MPSLKNEIMAVIKKLPEDADISDVMAELYALQRAQIKANKPKAPPPPPVGEPKRVGRPKKQI